MLRVDAQQLKAALLPSPTALLAQLGQILPQAAARIYNIFIEQLHGATTLLKTSITNVEEYVHQLAFMEECKVTSFAVPMLAHLSSSLSCVLTDAVHVFVSASVQRRYHTSTLHTGQLGSILFGTCML